jgi:hypothetical protein
MSLKKEYKWLKSPAKYISSVRENKASSGNKIW